MGPFAMGFITGTVVTVCIFLLVFGLVFWLRRRRTKGLTISSDNYARVLDHRGGGGIEMSVQPPPSSAFVISEDEREDITHLELQSNPELTPQGELLHFSFAFFLFFCFCFFSFLFVPGKLFSLISGFHLRIRVQLAGVSGPAESQLYAHFWGCQH
jgi:hypothetical protein